MNYVYVQEQKNELSDLVGATVQKIYIERVREQFVTFETDKGTFHYEIGGDCCSYSYISDFNRLRNLLDQKVTKVEYVEDFEKHKWDNEQYELTQTYGVRFHTDKGIAVMIFRNESNGYYGGYIEMVKNIPKGVRMVEIKSDYTATYKHV